MLEIPEDRCERHRLFKAIDDAFKAGDMRGVNDWTPLHYAVAIRSVDAIRLLLAAGADPALETRIDHYRTATEEAEIAGFEAGASLLRDAIAGRGSNGR